MKRIMLGFAVLGAMIVAAVATTAAFFQQPDPLPPTQVTPLPIITEPPIQGGVVTNPQWMSIDHHLVSIDVNDQIAGTRVDMQFTNNGSGMVEGTFLFPLPPEAAVDNLTMFVNGEPIEAKILRAEEARAVYNEVVRQYRDPALLEYVGDNAIQANVFPIPPGESRRIEIGYTQVLEAENGLLKITYPMETPATNNRMVNEVSIRVTVDGNDDVRNVYSPSHNVEVNRRDSTRFSAAFEAAQYTPSGDFVLYYAPENDTISANLITFREDANEDGYFMMLVQPPLTLPEDQIVEKDVILVIDHSGSMAGDKLAQAQDAANYVLNRLNPGDRFNVVVFGSQWRIFSDEMEPASNAREAADWVYSRDMEGGTNIDGALTTALDMVNPERPTTVLFLTDGQPTEGVTSDDGIMANLQANAAPNARIFTFGVGFDVNTFLLDRISQTFRGASSYVKPDESIEVAVSTLYGKISAPVLTDVEIEFDGVRTDLVYPLGQIPDLFAGEQLTIVGRYREGAEDVTISLSGSVGGENVTYTYDALAFRDRAGGEPFIARLWATRRIGDLLTQIRLNGETEELVNTVVDLSLRYGIITPYTSFLIEEDDILSQQGRERAAAEFQPTAQAMAGNASGGAAVYDADNANRFGSVDNLLALTATPAALYQRNQPQPQSAQASGTPPPSPMAVGTPGAYALPQVGLGITTEDASDLDESRAEMEMEADVVVEPEPERLIAVADKTFVLQDGVYTDTTFDPDTMDTEQVVFFSDAYFELLEQVPALAEYFAVGDAVIVVYEGTAYEVLPE